MVVALLTLLAMFTPKKYDWSLPVPVRPPHSGKMPSAALQADGSVGCD
jgi:hypothetical protein